MPDAIPDTSPMPYLVGKHSTGHFAYFGGGGVRRLGNAEIVFLTAESRVRTIDLDADSAAKAAATSKLLFGI